MAHLKDEAREVTRFFTEPVFPTVLSFVLGNDLILSATYRHAIGKRHHGPLDQRATEAWQVRARTIVVEPPPGLCVVRCREPLANLALNDRVKIENLIRIGQVNQAASLLIPRHECEVLNAIATPVEEHREPSDVAGILLGGAQFHARGDEAEWIACLAPIIKVPIGSAATRLMSACSLATQSSRSCHVRFMPK